MTSKENKSTFLATFFILISYHHIRGLTIPKDYDAGIRPNQVGSADVISVSMQMISLRKVDEHENSFTLDFMLRTSWKDPRLAYLVKLPTQFVNPLPKLWFPDIQIVDAASTSKSSDGAHGLTLDEEGAVVYSQRLSTTINCPLSSWRFPFGSQSCALRLSSFGYTSVHLQMVWNGVISDSEITSFDPAYSFNSLEQSSSRDQTAAGEFSNLTLYFYLSRNGLRHLIQTMGPTLMTVLGSYYTFFLKIKSPKSGGNRNGKDFEETQVSQLPLGLPSTLSLLRIGVNGLMVLLNVLTSQMNILFAPSFASITALDVWCGIMCLVVIIAFIFSIHGYFLEWRDSFGDERAAQGADCMETIQKWLVIGLPFFIVPFIIVFFAICLS